MTTTCGPSPTRTHIAAALLALILIHPSISAAQLNDERRQEAAQHFERGSLAYERGDYAEAEAEFQAAYDITAHPDLLYNLYSAAERGGHLDLAVDALTRYLRDGTHEDERRAAFEVRLERLRERVAAQQAEASAAAERAEEEREAQAAQLREAELATESAERAANEQRARRDEQLEAGHTMSDTMVTAGIGTLVGAGVAGVAFGAFAGLSEAEDQSVAGTCGRDAGRFCSPDDVATLRTWNTAADISWIAAAGLAATGAVIILVGEALRPGERPTAMVVPVLGPSTAGLVLRGVL